uniref:V-type proton ATPase subunit a n=1 Tax=Rhabditophanes sp. KR3021 TaxID=114890 RepID=A0AC35TP80_9BILA
MVKKKSSSKTGFKVLKRHNQFKNPHVVLVGNGTLVNQAYNPIKGVKQVGEGIVGKAPLVKSKRFNNLQGKFVNVSPDQLNKIIISSGLHFKVKGNVLGMNENIMGSLYRSELMSLTQIFMQSDAAYQCIAEVGEQGLCEFKDLNQNQNSFQRKFADEVKMCDDMDRIIIYINNCLVEEKIGTQDCLEDVPAPKSTEVSAMHNKFTLIQNELVQVGTNMATLKKSYSKINESKHILGNIASLLDSHTRAAASKSINEANTGHAGPVFTSDSIAPEISDKRDREESELSFICGGINSAKTATFERLLWRISRGKVFVRTQPIDDDENPLFEGEAARSAFIIFFTGKQLKSKIMKVCDAFHSHTIECPDSPYDRRVALGQLEVRLADLRTVITKTLEYKNRILFGTSHQIKRWEIELLKMKSIYNILNFFNVDVTHKCFIGEAWIPTNEIENVKHALSIGAQKAECHVNPVISTLPTHEMHPTYHKLNKFTRGFQNIVDSYGIANYREVNPAPWTIISFPFLFAVMFGDSGHGIVMLLGAITLVALEKKIDAARITDEIFNTFYGGRYVVLLMGCFSIYTGLVYNDFYSKSINVFGSAWKNPYDHGLLDRLYSADNESSLVMDIELSFTKEDIYPFGLDPVWNLAKNKLNFMNPMKMKSSIVLGITQMVFGVFLSLANYIHRGSALDFFFMFIPQMLFLGCIFIYLCIQVIIKWVYFSVTPGFIFGQYYPSSNCAPSLLIGLINMFMVKSRDVGFVKENHANGTVWDQCYLQQWYPQQGNVEIGLLLIAVIAIPVMLFVKPIFQLIMHKKGMHVDVGHSDGDGTFNFGDIMVYQSIHTIEFALGCISHTASYLRLWALSLAHAQLSEVLWTMVLHISFGMKDYIGSIAIYIIFIAFAFLSVSILVFMEGLSAFLHALRLHWVEFQSKFYGGTGIQFNPFSFHHIIRLAQGLEN